MATKAKQVLADPKKLASVSQRLFASTDKDKNGTIDSKELEGLMRRIASEYQMNAPSSQDVQDCLTKLDTNKDGLISKDEFQEFVVQLLSAL